jgi:hypothetical protein
MKYIDSDQIYNLCFVNVCGMMSYFIKKCKNVCDVT